MFKNLNTKSLNRGGPTRGYLTQHFCGYFLLFSPWAHTMPTSSLWSQLFFPHPLWRHSVNDLSLPVQRTSSIQIFPFPMPNVADEYTFTTNPDPSSRQTTLASVRSHPSSHTVPQVPLWNTSTRPWRIESVPSASRTANKWYKGFCVSVFVYWKGVRLDFLGAIYCRFAVTTTTFLLSLPRRKCHDNCIRETIQS